VDGPPGVSRRPEWTGLESPGPEVLVSRLHYSGPLGGSTPNRLHLPFDGHAPAATEPPSQPQPVFVPHRLDESNSRGEGVHREATEPPTSNKNEQRGAAAPEEYVTRSKVPAASPDGAESCNAEPDPTTSFYRAPKRTHRMGEAGQSSDSAPSLGRKELSALNRPKSDVIGVPSKSNSTIFSVVPRPHGPQSSSVISDSHIPVTPSGKYHRSNHIKIDF
jgi:hypothetical protein